MTLRNSFPTDLETGLPVLDTRLTLSSLVARDTDGNPRVGVVPDSLDPIVSGRSNMSYSVRSFRAITSRTGNGVELVANDGATTVSTTAAPSANARYDIIYVRARFSLNGDGSSAPEIGVVQGTAALNPSRPGVPAGAFALAEAYIPAGVSSTTSSGVVVTPVHPWTAAAGGTVVVRSLAELDAWTPADGSRAFNVADNGDYVRFGASWKRAAPRVVSGVVQIVPVANSSTSKRVDFPAGFFTATPAITVSAHTGVPGTVVEVSINNPSATGFDAVIMRTTDTSTAVNWIAVESLV